ncbi:MAG: PqqD family protein [Armatimonadetes bacterium]|nr:PqqD family protein [Armatimonadota bacterium]
MRVPLGLRARMLAGKYLPFLKLGPPTDRMVAFRLRPVRNSAIEWECDEQGEALLKVPYRKDKLGRALSFLVHLPEAKAVQLDEVGTFVWHLCDGEHTLEAIVKDMSSKYKMNRREAEMSVTTFLQMLSERRFVGFYERGGKQR